MARSSTAIVRDLDRFDPAETGWEPLGHLLEELMASAAPREGIDALFGVFERWPGAMTGGGWLWPVLHVLEGFRGYEPHLLLSLQRKPSVLAVMMVNRLLNAGISSIQGVPLLALLENAYRSPATMRTVKDEILSVLERHQPKKWRRSLRR